MFYPLKEDHKHLKVLGSRIKSSGPNRQCTSVCAYCVGGITQHGSCCNFDHRVDSFGRRV